MSLALFDLDHTLLDGDTDQLWGEFLARRGLLDLSETGPRLRKFHSQYLAGRLDARAYLNFILGLLQQLPINMLGVLRRDFMAEMIRPRISDGARNLVEKHRARGDTLLIITLTNRFLTEPIAKEFRVDALLATELEIADDRFTGQILGEPCYQHGKIRHLQTWMAANNESLENSHFYSDSVNDLPLLETVSCPVIVNPDKELARLAQARGWPELRLGAEAPSTS